MPSCRSTPRRKSPANRIKLRWLVPCLALATSACVSPSARLERAWYAGAKAKATVEHCATAQLVRPASADCERLMRYLRGLNDAPRNNVIICVPVRTIRQTKDLWNSLSPEFRERLAKDYWIGIHRRNAGDPPSSVPKNGNGSPNCIFLEN